MGFHFYKFLVLFAVSLMKFGAIGFISKSLNVDYDSVVSDDWIPMIQNCCLLIKELCIHTDSRREMSCAYENGRTFIKNSLIIEALIKHAKHFIKTPVLSSYALLAIRVMITNEEAVNLLAQHSIVGLIFEILTYFQPNVYAPVNALSEVKNNDTFKSVHLLLRSSFGLVRNLCADDSRKALIVSKGIVELIFAYLSNVDYFQDEDIVEFAIACIASISLRSAANSAVIINNNGAVIIEKSMRTYPFHTGIQKQCCCAIRNIAARCPQFHAIILDTGIESCIRNAGKISYVVDEAYAALRDLNCEVKMVKLNTDASGQVVQIENAFEEFGNNNANGMRLNFNPVYDETDELDEIVQAESHAPFAKSNCDETNCSDDDHHNHDHH